MTRRTSSGLAWSVWAAALIAVCACRTDPPAPGQDAEPTPDSGTLSDGGSGIDSGTPSDGGSGIDSGTPSDGGTAIDSGTPSDGGTADPGGPGPFVSRTTPTVTIPAAAGRSTDATLCAPSLDGQQVAPGKFPLVIVSPGFLAPRSGYQSYCEHLASWGFWVVLQAYSENGLSVNHDHLADDIGALNDWASSSTSPMYGSIEASQIATAGHSMGGKISIYGAIKDSRVKAVVGWDPVDANAPSVAPEKMGGLHVPLAVLGETLDGTGTIAACAPLADNYTQYYEAAGSPALELTLLGADHTDFVDVGSLPISPCRSGTADAASVRRTTRRTTVAFLNKHLRGDSTMDTFLTGAKIQADVAAQLLTIRWK